MKRIRFFSALLFCVLLTASCATKDRYYDSEYFLMDSYMTVRLATDGVGEDELADLSAEAMKLASDIEQEISKTVSDSDVAKFNSADKAIADFGKDFENVISVATAIADLTDGAYDPTLGALIDLWNISGGGPVPGESAIAEALGHVGYGKVFLVDNVLSKTDPGISLDLGGIGKGYAVQQVVSYLNGSGVEYGLCSFGSTVGVFGAKPDGEKFRITICDPANTSENVGEFAIDSGYISSSGDYERFFDADGKRYHHILDPKTGYPVDTSLHGVSVYSPNGQLSDALSTALFVMGVEKGLEFYASEKLDFEAVFVTDEGIYITDGLNGIFSVTSEKYKIIDQ